ncbi:hypothetical protein HBI56_178370 [Parastagonospora nodorum]|uniref:Uncharacterized protein n=2 Tax=Phaeosphaeria nodorum (strain SN15 / ATCC MYA-4574 / FGSC 10173) TaxID=321614 RepID=A0A7U2ET25_PHANO|nr:hypothetical protein HBH56_046930 [Parastagonospora nodorum]QRC92575.1 hypothetical protein JI435_083700 [Parastagonospora nodorum SN15]KAH3933383.1 hypothetical protein HBH54_074670 [Parastagonospora nodorum]KAH3946329.1 hypothetical protein HBH53_133810 [Parastagonospora nodorum]KAH3973339.1 hypothetical protein HBH52_146730 [Parastagonospora nodorum]
MSITSPGTYVMYRDLITGQPPVLAIVFPDDDAPGDIQQKRPHGYVYVSLILTVDEPYRFEWARTSQLSYARETANFWTGAGVGLDFWREAVRNQSKTGNMYANPYMDYPPADPNSDEEELDLDMKEALQLSREQHYGSDPSSSKPSFPTTVHSRRRTSSDVIVIDSDDEELYSRPPRKRLHYSPKRARPSRICEDLDMTLLSSPEDKRARHRQARSASPSTEIDGIDVEIPQRDTRPFSGAMSLDQLLRSSRLNQRAPAPVSDAIDGDIGDSKEYVQLVVGPTSEVRRLPMNAVWDRPYFQDSRTGINYFRQNEDGIWELHHPQLASITIDDFRFVGEYMEVERFGIRVPDTFEENKEAIAQCVAAWEAAEKLGMDDMLDHIANKVKYLEWDNEDMLIMATFVYRSRDVTLPGHTTIRDWAAKALAQHFWTYIKDANIGSLFRKLLRSLPELERDLFMRRATSLGTGVEMLEDQESDEDELAGDEHL